jgi:hypothetical protein
LLRTYERRAENAIELGDVLKFGGNRDSFLPPLFGERKILPGSKDVLEVRFALRVPDKIDCFHKT